MIFECKKGCAMADLEHLRYLESIHFCNLYIPYISIGELPKASFSVRFSNILYVLNELL